MKTIALCVLIFSVISCKSQNVENISCYDCLEIHIGKLSIFKGSNFADLNKTLDEAFGPERVADLMYRIGFFAQRFETDKDFDPEFESTFEPDFKAIEDLNATSLNETSFNETSLNETSYEIYDDQDNYPDNETSLERREVVAAESESDELLPPDLNDLFCANPVEKSRTESGDKNKTSCYIAEVETFLDLKVTVRSPGPKDSCEKFDTVVNYVIPEAVKKVLETLIFCYDKETAGQVIRTLASYLAEEAKLPLDVAERAYDHNTMYYAASPDCLSKEVIRLRAVVRDLTDTFTDAKKEEIVKTITDTLVPSSKKFFDEIKAILPDGVTIFELLTGIEKRKISVKPTCAECSLEKCNYRITSYTPGGGGGGGGSSYNNFQFGGVGFGTRLEYSIFKLFLPLTLEIILLIALDD